MPRPESRPHRDELRKLLDKGMTHEEIAKMYGVSKGTISSKISRAGWGRPIERYSKALPWVVRDEDGRRQEARMLRAAERRHRGLPMSERLNRELDRFLERLERDNVVLTYAPHLPEGPWVEIPREQVPEQYLDPVFPIMYMGDRDREVTV